MGLQRVHDITGGPATIWTEITPNDSADIPTINNQPPRAIYADDSGDIVCVDKEGNEATLAFAAGEIKPIRPVRIKATGTGVTTIVGLW